MALERTNYPSFSSLFDDFFGTELGDWKRKNYSASNTTLPKVNIIENIEGYIVEMAAPGMKKEDFNIQLNNNELTISSERKEGNGKEAQQFLKQEFAYQSFQRVFILPETADGEKIGANYENGILTVSIPKKEEAKPKPPRRISIN